MKTRLPRLFIVLVIGLGKDIQLLVEIKFYIFSSRILSLCYKESLSLTFQALYNKAKYMEPPYSNRFKDSLFYFFL